MFAVAFRAAVAIVIKVESASLSLSLSLSTRVLSLGLCACITLLLLVTIFKIFVCLFFFLIEGERQEIERVIEKERNIEVKHL